MNRLQPAALLDDLWEGELHACTVDGLGVLLLRRGDQVQAWRDRCPHLGFPLSRGQLDGHVLTCAAHHWQYDLRDGRGINPSNVQLCALPVSVHEGRVYVHVSGRTAHVA